LLAERARDVVWARRDLHDSQCAKNIELAAHLTEQAPKSPIDIS